MYSGTDQKWKVGDFGVARQPVTITETIRGTPCYRAPETFPVKGGKGTQITNSVDVWALGCIVFEMTLGENAFRSDFEIQNHFNEHDFLDCSEFALDQQISQTIQEMTHKSPSQRPSAKCICKQCHSTNSRFLNCSRNSPQRVETGVQTDSFLVPQRVETAVQTESLSIPQSQVEAHYVEQEEPPAQWKVDNATFCIRNSFILTGSREMNKPEKFYKIRLWILGKSEPLWEKCQRMSPYSVNPTFSPNGDYFITYCDAALEVVQLQSLKAIANFRPPSTTVISAISVNSTGKEFAYTFDASFLSSSSLGFTLEPRRTGNIHIAISAKKISDIAITYDTHGEWLFAVGKSDIKGLCGQVWDLRKRNLIQTLQFSAGEYRNFPLQPLSFHKPFITVLTSHPTPRDGVRNYLRIYTQKGNEAFKFGSERMICTSTSTRMLILTVGDLYYVNRADRYKDLPDFLVDDEIELEENWFYNETSVSALKNYQTKFFIWAWDGSKRTAECLGYSTSEQLPHYDEVVGFTLQKETITLMLEDGEYFMSQLGSLPKSRVIEKNEYQVVI